MARRDNALAIGAPLVKSIIFAIFGFLVLAILWIQFGQIRFTEQKEYSAIFTSANGMRVASPVTVNGVAVGRVDKVEIVNNNQAKASFTMDGYVPINTATLARIRYKNLTGNQYLDLTPGPGSETAPALEDGATIPISNTTSSLDIDALLNGFNPLLQGLQPEQVNQVSAEIVNVLQGQGGTINQVLQHVASFSGSLAQQDKVIGSVINNLNQVLGNLDTHSGDLNETVRAAQELISKLGKDKEQLTDGLEGASKLAYQVGDIAQALRTGHDTFEQLGRAMDRINDQGQGIDQTLRVLPGFYLRLGRLSVESAGYQLGICQVVLRLPGLDGQEWESPRIGPSENSPHCSSDNVAPLQGADAAWGPHGPFLGQSPWDGQQVVAGQRGVDDKKNFGHTVVRERANGNGR
jgi:phospholipid/cholesterol/gamma-HCH transport system substrate-binding protein